MTPTADIIVLGAGPAGVGLAYRAADAGHDVAVLEREHHVGGAAASFTFAGMRVDHGSHRLHRTIAPEILRDVRDLLGHDLQERQRHGRIRLARRWLPFPLTPVDTLTNLPIGFGLRAAYEAATSWARQPRADTFAEVVSSGLGPTMLKRFYGPYARKLWGLDPEMISGEQARRRVGASNPTALVRRAFAGRDPRACTFFYPRRGFGQTWEALATAAQDRGARLALGRTTTAIEQTPAGVRVRLDTGEHWTAKRLFSTIPLPMLIRLLGAQAPDAVTTAARRLRTRAMLLIYLAIDTPRYTPFDAHYLPEPWTPVTRISEPKNYRDGHPAADDPGDPADHTVLCAELPCAKGDAFWHSTDRALAGIVVAALRSSDLPEPTVTHITTRRLPSAYPIYDLDFARHLRVVDDWVATLPAITTYGRQGLFVHDNSHHALAMAWVAADALRPDCSIDRDAWAAARDDFTTHVVED